MEEALGGGGVNLGGSQPADERSGENAVALDFASLRSRCLAALIDGSIGGASLLLIATGLTWPCNAINLAGLSFGTYFIDTTLVLPTVAQLVCELIYVWGSVGVSCAGGG